MKKSPKKKQAANANRHYLRGNTLFSKGEYQEAAAEYLQALKLNPGLSDVFNNLGNCMNQLGQTEEATKCFQNALAADPENSVAYTNLGNLLREKGNTTQAMRYLLKAAEVDSKNIRARISLANILMELSRYREAAQILYAVTRIDATNAEAYCNLANATRELYQFDEAVTFARKATELNPNMLEAWHNLAACYFDHGRFEESIDVFHHALELDPNFFASQRGLLLSLKKRGHYDDALSMVNSLLQDFPDNCELLAAKADVLDFMGETSRSLDIVLSAVDSGKRDCSLLCSFARLCKHHGRCEEAANELESFLTEKQNEIPARQVATSHYQLGATYDGMGRYESAFEHFHTANELKRTPFDRQQFLDFVQFNIDTFDKHFFAHATYASADSQRPVFILGMPRSGSSLTEQILASHKDVYGAGELRTIPNLGKETATLAKSEKEYPRLLPELNGEQLDTLAQSYLDHIENLAGGERLVTDKLPHNFMHVALISLLFPHSHIIHTVRNPMDTCLSCYFQDFLNQLNFTYRLDDLGFYYCHYARLMEHWKKVIPVPTLTVNYEELVEDTESQVRRMLDFLDLEWDANCLQFHKSKRAVLTASRDQVKQPIYKKSKQRWRNYEKYLDPLKEELAKSDLNLLEE